MIYVHVPFCRSFCTYCDFYSELCPGKASQQVQKRVIDDYVDGILAELHERFPHGTGPGGVILSSDAVRHMHPSGISRTAGPGLSEESREGEKAARVWGGTPNTLYMGGGTPSVLPLEAVERIVRALGPAEYEEFTIEVNPDDICEKGVEYVRGLVGLGVNRISMGVQSFDDGILRWMNRRHDARGARSAAGIIRGGGVRNLSIDLIFGLSQLTQEQWRRTIAGALKLEPEHISAYQLSIEDGSALGRLVREGRYTEAADEQCRRQYDTLCEELARAGYLHYEISNWALPGYEARHNSAYWRRVPYIGLGPGAHSLGYAGPEAAAPDLRSWNSETPAQRRPDGSLARWSRESETLSASEVSEETVMLALRTAAGLGEAALRQLAGSAAVDGMLAEGSLIRCPGPAGKAGTACRPDSRDYCARVSDARLRIPESRFFVSNDIIARLLA